MNKDAIIGMVNDALETAYRLRVYDDVDFGAVNWADLECVELIGTHDGWIAYVEEAAPDCKLPEHVSTWLSIKGIENVSVITRW